MTLWSWVREEIDLWLENPRPWLDRYLDWTRAHPVLDFLSIMAPGWAIVLAIWLF